jgi:hypothetical protein
LTQVAQCAWGALATCQLALFPLIGALAAGDCAVDEVIGVGTAHVAVERRHERLNIPSGGLFLFSLVWFERSLRMVKA